MKPLNKKSSKIIIVSGTTASGKTTIVEKFLQQTELPFAKIRTSTTRHKRPTETNGVDYNFLSENEFKKAITNNEFLEWAMVHDKYYGTPQAAVDEELAKGNNVILIIDVQGAFQIREKIPTAVLIFIKTENFTQIRERIIKRHGSVPADLDARLKSAQKELELADKYDYQIINYEDKINDAVADFNEVINRELL